MRIARIDLWHVAVPLDAPFHPAWIPGFRQVENRFDLLRLTTASGIMGWSAMPAMGAEREGWGELLGSYVLGERADDLANIRQRIRELGYLGHRAGGLLEPACWDIVGKARELPVHRLLNADLGAPVDRVRLYASTGEVRSGTARVAEVQDRLAEGFDAVKLRVHADTLDEDIDQLRAVRQECGDDVVLGVDANQGWRVAAIADCARWDADRARAFCDAAADVGVAWVEEPLPMDDYAGLAAVTAATPVAIAGGELNNHGLPELKHMIAAGCYDWYQPDACMVGGISEAWAIQQHAIAAGASYSPHTWTNGIGFAINLQLFAASAGRADKRLEYPLDPPGWTPAGRDGLLTRPFLHERGWLPVPQGPGLGIDIDRAALRRFGRHFYTATRARVAAHAVLDRGLSLARHLGGIRQGRLDARDAKLQTDGGDPFLDPLRALGPAGRPPTAGGAP